MPNIHMVEQGTPEWLALRAGLPTASCFDKIVTPTGALSKSARSYKALLLAERVIGRPIETKQSPSMIRGTQFEAEAVEFYERLKDIKTERIGFVTNDSNTLGASPDRWAGDEGQLEIKVPEVHTQMAYFLAQCNLDKYGEALESLLRQMQESKVTSNGTWGQVLADPKLQERYDEAVANSLAREYKVQTHGQVLITKRAWSDLLSYSPEGLPPVFVHIDPDMGFMRTLDRSVHEFSRDLEESAADLVKRGIIPQDS